MKNTLSLTALVVLNKHFDEIEAECPDVTFDRNTATLEAEWLELDFMEVEAMFELDPTQPLVDALTEHTVVAGLTDNNTVVFQKQ